MRGGGRGIRTPGTVSRTAVFKTACFNHSHIPPILIVRRPLRPDWLVVLRGPRRSAPPRARAMSRNYHTRLRSEGRGARLVLHAGAGCSTPSPYCAPGISVPHVARARSSFPVPYVLI